jgi:hypothetical protein
MPALPSKDIMSLPFPAPTDAQARAWFLAMHDSFSGLLGVAATPESARNGLQLPVRAAQNILDNSDFSMNRRGKGLTGLISGDYFRDQWVLSGDSSVNTFTASQTMPLTHSGSGFLKQSVGQLPAGTYTLSTLGSLKTEIWIFGTGFSEIDGPFPASFQPTNSNNFTEGPKTFTIPPGLPPTPYDVVIYVANGPLTGVLLQKGSFATPANELAYKPDNSKQFYQVLPLSFRFLASAANQYGDYGFVFPVEMAGVPTATYLSGQVNSPNLALRSVVSLSKYGGRFTISSSASGDCYC